MYGIAELIEYPNSEDPKLQRIELFDSLKEAINRANRLIDVFFEEFGGDYCLEATEKNMFAFATNDEVVWRAYITSDRKKYVCLCNQ